MNIINIFLPVYFVIYVTLVFVWRTWIVWKRTRVSPFVFGKSDNAYDYIGKIYKMLLLVTAVVILINAFLPQWTWLLQPIHRMHHGFLQYTGLILLLIALIWILVAQRQMADSWRIGISTQKQTNLITHGLFSISRNPVFLGVQLTYFGLFLVLPNTFTLLISAISWFTMQIQVRLEEAHLTEVHGSAYQDYLLKVRRWV